ncbi:hypothetical protein [Micromonospora peucetia]|uniref:Uncharacterized protein n=1 Tax=Micromonospora peucetia TaxID=47871 RepID=A0ABZ1EJT6_9ACTN|nr:hypothetical protein [Micromonospora peucetia]WSA34513.1 hypothetical protein OIE14_10965 [Micromonospora peucetia]
MTADEIREQARQLAATLPPISQTQLNQLRLILRPGGTPKLRAAKQIGRAA